MSLDRSLISRLPAFAGLSADDLDAVLANARALRVSKGSEVFSQDSEAGHFYLLLSGHVRVVRTTPDGDQVIARYINEGEWFGIAVTMGRTTYPASAVAAVDCVVLSWPNSAWTGIKSRFPSIAAGTYQTIGARLEQAQARVVEMSTQQVEQRFASAVLRLVAQSGRQTGEGIEIDFPLSRQDLAELTGSTLHTVSRLLSAWEEQGIVRSGRQRVTVTNPHALVLIVENRRQG